MKRETIATKSAPEAIGPYSQGVRVGETLYLSGQIPLDPATMEMVQGAIAEQTAQVLKNLGAVLEAAGLSFRDVVKTTVYMTDLSQFVEMNSVYEEVFSEKPARATVQVSALPKGALVEIEAIAVGG
jgi:2-iminobutanoate/2-iminopropanoate deaminase